MYTKILVPLDGSKLAEAILPYARALAKGLKVPVELLTAIDPEIITTFTDPAHSRYVDVIEGDMKRNSIAYLKQIARSFSDPTAVTCLAEIAKPAETIIERGARHGTLIAMSTHGRTGILRWVLGSVADKVLHATKNHLLLVRPNNETQTEGEARLNSIILPLDGSSLAERAMHPVLSLAKVMNLEVILLRVFVVPHTAYYGGEAYAPNMEALMAMIKSESKVYLETKREQLLGEGLDKVSMVMRQGDPSSEIIDFAAETPDNLVAMCTHGRSGVERWVMGSVTARVVRHSGDPVLVVQAESS